MEMKTVHNREWMVVVALSLLVALLRLPSLEQPFDNDSGAIAYHARLIVRGEPLYSTHHPAHHVPAVYYTYALAFLLFGDSVWAVKFLLILWTIVTVYLIYQLGTMMMDRTTGLLAAVFYAVLSSHVGLFGSTAEIELFANLPRVVAILVIMRLTARHAAAWKFVLVGLLGAAAFLFKVVYLSPLVMACFVLLAELRRNRAIAGAWREAVMRGLWVGIGFGAGLLSVVAYFALLGLLPRFLLVFQLGQGYVNFRATDSPLFQYWPLLPFIGLGRNNIVLLVCSFGGLVAAVLDHLRGSQLRRGGLRQSGSVSSATFYVSIWYVLSLIESNVTCIFFPHYYLLNVPPLALLAAWFLLKFYRGAKNQIRTGSRLVALFVPIALLVAALLVSVEQNFTYYFLYARYRLGIGTYRDFLLDGWSDVGPEFARVQELASYVQGRTSPSDYIYYWSGGVQLYYVADRRCPIDIIWPLYAEVTGSYRRIFVPRTKYVLVGDSNSIVRPDWLYTALAEEGYTLETIIEGQEVYRRVD
jgi:4-amino-4-deoxy-L-arabinose transferase-like glycosyltransferase